MKKTISVRIGKGSISHNNRKFVAKNVDEKRIKDNMVLCNVDIKKTYDDLFGAALAEYNAKQKRKDRRIENYLEHIENGKQEKPFYELIFQIGNKDDTPCGTRDAEIATDILHEYYEEFLKRNPHIKVFIAIHKNILTLDNGGKIEIGDDENAKYRSTRIDGKGI